jgi:D-alanyl-D-alanine dipeptidase
MHQNGFVAYDQEYWHFEAMDKTWVRENCERL